ncbi:MAG: hypothetical protein U0Q18_15920 [Bryobacteraceae bacterium]
MADARSDRMWSLLAVAAGALAAVVALHSDDLQFAVLFLFVQGAVFGFGRPARAWRWACLLAVCIPLALLLNLAIGLPSPREFSGPARLFVAPLVVFFRSTTPVSAGGVIASGLSVAPALAGAYLGAWMSRVGDARGAARL